MVWKATVIIYYISTLLLTWFGKPLLEYIKYIIDEKCHSINNMYFMFLKRKNASHVNGTEYSNRLKGFKNKTPHR